MSSLTPDGTISQPEESIEKKIYNIVNNLNEYLPVTNDRNRLGFDLYKFVIGEGDEPLFTIKNSKVQVQGISIEELAKRISAEIAKVKAEK